MVIQNHHNYTTINVISLLLLLLELRVSLNAEDKKITQIDVSRIVGLDSVVGY